MSDLTLVLGRLEVLTDLTEFVDKQVAKNSTYTAGWAPSAQYMEWLNIIKELRAGLTKEQLEAFDGSRQRKYDHREDCGCLLCKERRGII